MHANDYEGPDVVSIENTGSAEIRTLRGARDPFDGQDSKSVLRLVVSQVSMSSRRACKGGADGVDGVMAEQQEIGRVPRG